MVFTSEPNQGHPSPHVTICNTGNTGNQSPLTKEGCVGGLGAETPELGNFYDFSTKITYF